MDVFQIDDDGRLFISPAIDDWDSLAAYNIDTVIDLEGGLDTCIPTIVNQCLYVYFPIADDDQALPNLIKLRAIARLGASLVREGHCVLSHCGMGYNRSAPVDGLILTELGIPGPVAKTRWRDARAGAATHQRFPLLVT